MFDQQPADRSRAARTIVVQLLAAFCFLGLGAACRGRDGDVPNQDAGGDVPNQDAGSDGSDARSPDGCGPTGARTLYTVEGQISIVQPTIAGDQIVVATGTSIVLVPVSGGAPRTLVAAKYSSVPIVLEGVVYFQTIETAAPPQQSSYAQGNAVVLSDGSETPMPTFGSFAPIATDGSSLYLAAASGAYIESWLPPSSTLVNVVADPSLFVSSIAIQGDYVYVAAQDVTVGGFLDGVIARASKAGGGSLERIVTNIGHPWNLAADDAGLYWAEDPPGIGAGSGRLARSNLDGSSPTTLLQQNLVSLAVGDGLIYFSTGSEIDIIPRMGGIVTTVANSLDNAGLLAVAGVDVIWVEPSTQKLSSDAPVFIRGACQLAQ